MCAALYRTAPLFRLLLDPLPLLHCEWSFACWKSIFDLRFTFETARAPTLPQRRPPPPHSDRTSPFLTEMLGTGKIQSNFTQSSSGCAPLSRRFSITHKQLVTSATLQRGRVHWSIASHRIETHHITDWLAKRDRSPDTAKPCAGEARQARQARQARAEPRKTGSMRRAACIPSLCMPLFPSSPGPITRVPRAGSCSLLPGCLLYPIDKPSPMPVKIATLDSDRESPFPFN